MNTEEMILYLLRVTKYAEKYLYSLKEDKIQIIYKRIYTAIPIYIKEIITYQEQNNLYEYTEKYLKKLTYNELVEIRKKYKIRNHKKTNNKQTTDKIDSETNIQELDDYSYITRDEAYEIFGEDFINMSKRELADYGYMIYESGIEPSNYIKYLETTKNKIINFLIEIHYTKKDGTLYKRKDLENIDYTTLRLIYEDARRKFENLPSYEKILKKAQNNS